MVDDKWELVKKDNYNLATSIDACEWWVVYERMHVVPMRKEQLHQYFEKEDCLKKKAKYMAAIRRLELKKGNLINEKR